MTEQTPDNLSAFARIEAWAAWLEIPADELVFKARRTDRHEFESSAGYGRFMILTEAEAEAIGVDGLEKNTLPITKGITDNPVQFYAYRTDITRPAPARKLTAMERRAKQFSEEVRTYGSAQLAVYWKTNRTWGLNPSVEGNGVKIGYASGCGYCKESAALADALRFLGKDAQEQDDVWRTSGCGVESVAQALRRIGYELETLHIGKRENAYRVVRKTAA